MVAPLAKTAVIPTAGLAPFVSGKDGVDADPNGMFFRSFWTVDAEAETFGEFVQSHRRVATVESGLNAGRPVNAAIDPTGDIAGPLRSIWATDKRRSALSSRFLIWNEFFDDGGADEYNEGLFIGLIKPQPYLLDGSQYVRNQVGAPPTEVDAASSVYGRQNNFSFRSRSSAGEDSTGTPLLDGYASLWGNLGGPYVGYDVSTFSRLTAAIYLNDGTDGNRPVMLAEEVPSVEGQVEFMRDPAKASKVYFGFPIATTFDGGPQPTPSFLTPAMGHSISPDDE